MIEQNKAEINQLLSEIKNISKLNEMEYQGNIIPNDIRNRPIFLLAPMSYWGMVKCPEIVKICNNIVAAIDDQSKRKKIHGVARWSSKKFKQKVSTYPDAVAIDLSCSPNGKKFVGDLLKDLRVQKITPFREPLPLIQNFDNKKLFIMSPKSVISDLHLNGIVSHSQNVVAMVDDAETQESVNGIQCWTRSTFLDKAKYYKESLAIDFSYTQYERAIIQDLCKIAGVEYVDSLVVIAHCGQHAVYEPARIYRQRTLLNLEKFLRFASRLEDELSINTLYRNILFRLTYDRNYLIPILSTPQNEYFSGAADTSTFQLGNKEHYCDCGAFTGGVVKRFLMDSNNQYESIVAFEPDSINFKELQDIASPYIKNFQPINKAISNKKGSIYFNETGTVSSHITEAGKKRVSLTKLDDELEKLTLLKMDIEGFEAKAIQGAARLIRTQRPRIAACVYHNALDLLDVVEELDKLVDDYHYRLRQHFNGYYYDLVLYASPVAGNSPPKWASSDN